MDRLLHAVDLGIDIHSLVVDPCLALHYACERKRSYAIRNSMQTFFFVPLLPSLECECLQLPQKRPLKWRAGQTLLEMAIRCGQLDATRYLTHAHCEATGLTASDLAGPMFHQQFVEDDWIRNTTINRSVGAAEAARLAYHLCRHRYQT